MDWNNRYTTTTAATASRMGCIFFKLLALTIVVFYISLTIFFLLILSIDKCVFFWVCIGDRIFVDSNLDCIPRWPKCFLSEPKSGEFEDDITHLPWLYGIGIDNFLLGVVHLGHIKEIACDFLTDVTGGVRCGDYIV